MASPAPVPVEPTALSPHMRGTWTAREENERVKVLRDTLRKSMIGAYGTKPRVIAARNPAPEGAEARPLYDARNDLVIVDHATLAAVVTAEDADALLRTITEGISSGEALAPEGTVLPRQLGPDDRLAVMRLQGVVEADAAAQPDAQTRADRLALWVEGIDRHSLNDLPTDRRKAMATLLARTGVTIAEPALPPEVAQLMTATQKGKGKVKRHELVARAMTEMLARHGVADPVVVMAQHAPPAGAPARPVRTPDGRVLIVDDPRLIRPQDMADLRAALIDLDQTLSADPSALVQTQAPALAADHLSLQDRAAALLIDHPAIAHDVGTGGASAESAWTTDMPAAKREALSREQLLAVRETDPAALARLKTLLTDAWTGPRPDQPAWAAMDAEAKAAALQGWFTRLDQQLGLDALILQVSDAMPGPEPAQPVMLTGSPLVLLDASALSADQSVEALGLALLAQIQDSRALFLDETARDLLRDVQLPKDRARPSGLRDLPAETRLALMADQTMGAALLYSGWEGEADWNVANALMDGLSDDQIRSLGSIETLLPWLAASHGAGSIWGQRQIESLLEFPEAYLKDREAARQRAADAIVADPTLADAFKRGATFTDLDATKAALAKGASEIARQAGLPEDDLIILFVQNAADSEGNITLGSARVELVDGDPLPPAGRTDFLSMISHSTSPGMKLRPVVELNVHPDALTMGPRAMVDTLFHECEHLCQDRVLREPRGPAEVLASRVLSLARTNSKGVFAAEGPEVYRAMLIERDARRAGTHGRMAVWAGIDARQALTADATAAPAPAAQPAGVRP